MPDASQLTDRQILEALYNGLINKERLFANAGDDDAPDPVQPTAGVERVLGPKPHPSQATASGVWRTEAAKVTKVYDDIPDEYENSALKLAAATGVVAVFVEYAGKTTACLRPGLPPALWLVEASRFVSDDDSDVDALIEIVRKAK